MTTEQTICISQMMRDGYSCRKIAEEMNLSLNTVKSWCRRHPYKEKKAGLCMMCSKAISSIPNKRERKFCSDQCRNAWWSAHPENRKTKTMYKHICFNCGREFTNNRINACYCCRKCFADARRKAV